MRGFVATSYGQTHVRMSSNPATNHLPALVLLHRTADSITQWDDVWDWLAESFYLVAIDTPGFGESSVPPSAPGIAGYARNVVEVLEAFNLRQIVLLGHRTGASIAVEVAASSPDHVGRLILSGCPDYDPEARAAMAYPRSRSLPEPTGEYLSKSWRLATWNLGDWARPDQVARSMLDSQRAVNHPYWAYEAVYQQDIRARLALIHAPVLLLYGESDPFARRATALAAAASRSRVQVFPGANALTMLQIPQDFSRAVIDYGRAAL